MEQHWFLYDHNRGRYNNRSGDAFDEESGTGLNKLVLRGSSLESVHNGASVSTVDLDVLVQVVRTSKPLGTNLIIIFDKSVEHQRWGNI